MNVSLKNRERTHTHTQNISRHHGIGTPLEADSCHTIIEQQRQNYSPGILSHSLRCPLPDLHVLG
jgi:hypothetical protein